MADLFPEVERRMVVAHAYARWKDGFPWRRLPARLRPVVFTRFFVEREVRKIHG